MTRWYLCLIIGVFTLAGPVGCSEDPSSSPPPQQQTVVKTPPATQVAPPEAEVAKEKEAPFVYVSEGRRDPFVPLTTIRRPIENAGEPATPLERYDLTQFRLIGIVIGRGEPKAMVVAPDGKSYMLSKGVKIGKNNGVIIEMNSEVIRVLEKYYDFSGNIIENIQEISVPNREGV